MKGKNKFALAVFLFSICFGISCEEDFLELIPVETDRMVPELVYPLNS